MAFINVLEHVQVIAILRSNDSRHLATAAEALIDAGLPLVEFALTTPAALDALAALAPSVPAGSLGAGTVLTASDAHRAVDAGAAYLVTPTVELAVLEAGRELGVPIVCGAFTPTELLSAHRAGAQAVKVFPAATVGPGYLRALLAPLPGLRLVPTGGIAIDEVPAYLQTGAFAVGMGSQLVGDACEGGSVKQLAGRAQRLVAAVAEANEAEAPHQGSAQLTGEAPPQTLPADGPTGDNTRPSDGRRQIAPRTDR